ncbi:MAG: hypothetical protein WCB90_00880 [Methanosarcina sp.]
MTSDLIVDSGTTVVLNDNPPANLGENLKSVEITKLKDLVDLGFVDSNEILNQLLNSAKKATSIAISSRETFFPKVFVPGTTKPDMRRFASFVANTPNATPLQQSTVWRTIRDIEPAYLENIDIASDLKAIKEIGYKPFEVKIWRFKNITVQPNSTLKIDMSNSVIKCYDLVIKRTGKIEVQSGGGVYIKAHSITGDQRTMGSVHKLVINSEIADTTKIRR